MFVKKNRKRGRPLLRKRTYRKKSAPKVGKVVKRYVKRELARQVETKSFYVNQQISFGSYNQNNQLNFAPILWQSGYHTLASGVLDGQKLGNKVTLKRVLLKYVLVPLEYNASTNISPTPMFVQLFLCRLKNAKSTNLQAGDVAMIWNQGSTTAAPTASLQDINAMRNTDYIDFKKVWVERLAYSGYNGSGSNVNAQYYNNSDFPYSVVRTIDVTSMLQKVCVWNDSAQTVQNGNLFFGFQSVSASGGVFGASTVNTRINYSIHIEYEDC